MRAPWKYIVLSCMFVLGATACQTLETRSVCRPTVSPFPTPPVRDPWDVRFAYAPNVPIRRVCSLSGHVTRGEVYQQAIVKNLFFCLRPSTDWHENDGWAIVISDTTGAECGPALDSIVTPPFHGMNSIYISGWHFRNASNTGENDGSVNAPQKNRPFNFIFNQKDYETLSIAFSCESWNDCQNGMTLDKAVSITAATPKSAGVMRITKLALGNLVPNDKAWIESMDFEVQIYLPGE